MIIEILSVLTVITTTKGRIQPFLNFWFHQSIDSFFLLFQCSFNSFPLFILWLQLMCHIRNDFLQLNNFYIFIHCLCGNLLPFHFIIRQRLNNLSIFFFQSFYFQLELSITILNLMIDTFHFYFLLWLMLLAFDQLFHPFFRLL